MELIGLKRCSTCREIEQLLKAKGIAYTYREIDKQNPSAEELLAWYQRSSAPTLKRLVNTSGLKYRELNLKDRWEQLTQAEQLNTLAQDGMLVKRPILLTAQGDIYIGATVKTYVQGLDSEATTR